MKQRIPVVLLATMMSATAWGQEVSVTSTTIAQLWTQDIPGFAKSTYTPATQFLGIDATSLGSESLSLHLFGWGRADLRDESTLRGKSSGDLSFGYLRYRFQQANAEVKAGRFSISQGAGVELVDGVSARTDLRGGFNISAFGGKPVTYKGMDALPQKDFEFQHDFIMGSRLGFRVPKMGEVGVSFLQDGTTAAKDLDIPSPNDYTRKLVGGDIRLAPHAAVLLNGRTTLDVAHHSFAIGKRNRVAEHDYSLTVKTSELVTVTGDFVERNFQSYYAGSNFQSLFRQNERDKHRSYGGSVVVGSVSAWEVVADYRHIHRDTYGDANRLGGELRWNFPDRKIQTGLGYHHVSASDALLVDGKVPSYSLSHGELRGFLMLEDGPWSLALDAIHHSFSDVNNPHLAGRKALYEMVASLGFKTTENLKVSGDVAYGASTTPRNDMRGLLRVEYRFGMSRKGGK